MNHEENTVNSTRRKPKHRKTAASTLLTIFIIALVCAVVIVGALYVSGIRLIREQNVDGDEIKFFGRTENGAPYSGTVYYPDRKSTRLNSSH